MKKRLAHVAVAILGLLLVPNAALAAPGDLDLTFGTDGIVTTDTSLFGQGSDRSWASSGEIQPDGRIVVAGASTRGISGLGLIDRFAVARYLPDGSLDPSFGADGTVVTRFSVRMLDASRRVASARAYGVAIQDNGKIVTAGVVDCPNLTEGGDASRIALARYLPDGSLDPSFGNGGRVQTSFETEDAAYAMALQGHGRIVLGGTTNSAAPYSFALARYRKDGSLDASFGDSGLATFDPGGTVYDLAIKPDNRIVAVGSGAYAPGHSPPTVLARFLPDGSIDPSFGADGWTAVDTGTDSSASDPSLLIQPDQKIVVGAGKHSEHYQGFLARFDPDGTPDTSFGTEGLVTIELGSADSTITGLALDANGSILAGGTAFHGEGAAATHDYALARVAPDGSLDSAFGSTGVVTTDLGASDYSADLLLDSSDHPILVGGGGPGLGVALTRYVAA